MASVVSWTERAACRGRTATMFPTPTGWLTANRAHIDPARYEDALAICTGCPVVDDCRRLLADDPHLWSSEAVIAGTTPLERLAMPDPWGARARARRMRRAARHHLRPEPPPNRR